MKVRFKRTQTYSHYFKEKDDSRLRHVNFIVMKFKKAYDELAVAARNTVDFI